MVDPQVMLMLMNILGKEYIVWDKSSEIEFIKPGKSAVRSVITISDEEIEKIKRMTTGGQKYFPEFNLEIVDNENKVVASVRKVLYVRKKRAQRS